MADVILFHHAQGLTDGMHAFADDLRQAGHTVHLPDLFGGRTFDSIDDGLAYAREVGFGKLIEQGCAFADELGKPLVYGGFSLGVPAAQKLAQTRATAKGALLFYSCMPATEFGDAWPAGVPVQIHGMDEDPFFVGEGDVEFARAIVDSTDRAELFLYPGKEHYFADSSLASYDKEATALLTERVLEFLRSV